jgi:hypothetical protein
MRFVFVGGETSAPATGFLTPSTEGDTERAIFICRVFTARRTIENVFGISTDRNVKILRLERIEL